MKKILLILGLMIGLIGCADTTTDTAGSSTGGGASAETLAQVDNAFLKEYSKHISGATAPISAEAENNIKSLLQNITGRGSMPSTVGIGEVSSVITSSAMAKKISVILNGQTADASAKSLLDYATLNVPANTFLQTVISALMSGTTGSSMLSSLKLYQANQTAIEKLTLAHLNKFGITTENDNVTVNLSYLYASLTDYFTQLKITSLPTDDETVSKMVDAVYNHCNDGANNILSSYEVATSSFTVMPIISCGKGMPDGLSDMTTFMNNIGQIFDPNYSFSMAVSPAQ